METMRAWIDSVIVRLSAKALARHQVRLKNHYFASRATGRQCRCGETGCRDEAMHFVRWGAKHGQSGNLCSRHFRELWDRVQGLVATGQCWWSQGYPDPDAR